MAKEYVGRDGIALEPPLDIYAAEREASAALHEAIGWLTGSIEREHPGFLRAEADSAAKHYPERQFIGVLAAWADAAAKRAVAR